MNSDPIIKEIHEYRTELMAKFKGDRKAFMRFIQEQERESGREIIPVPASARKKTHV